MSQVKAAIQKYDLSKEYYFTEGCFITELSNTQNDEDVSIARARVAPGKTTKWHFLKSITERYVILEGCGRVEIGKLPPQTVETGDVVVIPPMTHQRITNTGEHDLVFLAICSPRFTEKSYVNV